MSQPIGNSFKSRIPTFSDDASIQEAFRVYHYGKDNYNESEAVPPNSIEGHFVTATNRIGALETSVSALPNIYILKTSTSSNPNLLTTNNIGVSPLSIRGLINQSAPLQNWQNSSATNVVSVFNDGGAFFANYVAVGNAQKPSNVALDVRIGNATDRGIVVQAAFSPTANIQEWVANNGTTILARVDSTGKLFSNNIEVVTLSQTQTLTNKTISGGTVNATTLQQDSVPIVTTTGTQILTNKTLTSPTISSGSFTTPTISGATISGTFTSTATITGGTMNPGTLQQNGVAVVTISGSQTLTNKTLTSPSISSPSISNASISGGTISASTISVFGSQALSARVRNITISTSNSPFGGNDGDIWIQYV
jgi:hypothetical protein